ncbi:MAG: cob(I)yrinic acid a,c-diamide adenosyltransferase [Saprospiraceae bacterium]|nr:cob(I)yrinic acid a,c-diamide adenosyltransferase [Saprospiraceae bacterium]
MKIYTKTGDKGTTGLFGGKRVSKDDIRVEAYGTVDELNSSIGLLIAHLQNHDINNFLGKIQNELFVIGSHLASDPSKKNEHIPDLKPEMITDLEQAIDMMDAVIPPLKFFVLPGGSVSIATAHLCRTICRRAERRIVTLSHNEAVDESIIIYFNRLSDYLFTLSRYIAHIDRVEEIPWINK